MKVYVGLIDNEILNVYADAKDAFDNLWDEIKGAYKIEFESVSDKKIGMDTYNDPGYAYKKLLENKYIYGTVKYNENGKSFYFYLGEEEIK